MVEVSLMCALVGNGVVFPVDIDDNKSVGHLKDVIAMKEKYNFAASHLQLFPGKTTDGKWLSSRSVDVMKLKKGEKTALTKVLTREDLELQGEESIDEFLADMETPKTKQIHVLVVVPEQKQSLSLVSASIENALTTNGLHRRVYHLASYLGYYILTFALAKATRRCGMMGRRCGSMFCSK